MNRNKGIRILAVVAFTSISFACSSPKPVSDSVAAPETSHSVESTNPMNGADESTKSDQPTKPTKKKGSKKKGSKKKRPNPNHA